MNPLKVPVHPTATRADIEKILSDHGVTQRVAVVGIRGYDDGTNERGIYDDALFIISPRFFNAYNANTDPSVTRPGIAVLQPGIYEYKKGMHGVSGPHPYLALRQAGDVTVLRDGNPTPQTDSSKARFWIDIHRGGYGTTSSLGCQTIHPDQWSNFRDNIFREMEKEGQALVPYLLVNK